MDTRLEILEVAATRPSDIQDFYAQWLIKESGHWFLHPDAPEYIHLLYRGKLRSYKAKVTLILLAGKTGIRTCNRPNCLNPDHML